MPALSGIGFLSIGYAPILAVLAVFQVVRRATGFALLRPAREILFTVLRREDKYKAKSFIDTFVYRVADQVGAWSYSLLRWLGDARGGEGRWGGWGGWGGEGRTQRRRNSVCAPADF